MTTNSFHQNKHFSTKGFSQKCKSAFHQARNRKPAVQYISGRPVSIQQANMMRQKVHQNIINNKRFYQITHTDFTHNNLKDQASIRQIAASLPDEYVDIFANKNVCKTRGELAQLMMRQTKMDISAQNKKEIGQIQKQCIQNQDNSQFEKLKLKE